MLGENDVLEIVFEMRQIGGKLLDLTERVGSNTAVLDETSEVLKTFFSAKDELLQEISKISIMSNEIKRLNTDGLGDNKVSFYTADYQQILKHIEEKTIEVSSSFLEQGAKGLLKSMDSFQKEIDSLKNQYNSMSEILLHIKGEAREFEDKIAKDFGEADIGISVLKGISHSLANISSDMTRNPNAFYDALSGNYASKQDLQKLEKKMDIILSLLKSNSPSAGMNPIEQKTKKVIDPKKAIKPKAKEAESNNPTVKEKKGETVGIAENKTSFVKDIFMQSTKIISQQGKNDD